MSNLEMKQLNNEKDELYKAIQEKNYPLIGKKCSKILKIVRAIVAQLGIDPDCPNCDGTGGAYPNGACGTCWVWRGRDWE